MIVFTSSFNLTCDMIVFTSSFNLTSPGLKVHVRYCHLFTSIFAECSIHYLFTLIFCIAITKASYCLSPSQTFKLSTSLKSFEQFWQSFDGRVLGWSS